MQVEKRRLFTIAEEYSLRSYSPYSGYRVGAAVVGSSGTVYGGSSIEIASYGLSICAEKVAVAKALSEGEATITALAVFSSGGDGSPCGSCRQFIHEFGDSIWIYFYRSGVLVEKTIGELLPEAFPIEKKPFIEP